MFVCFFRCHRRRLRSLLSPLSFFLNLRISFRCAQFGYTRLFLLVILFVLWYFVFFFFVHFLIAIRAEQSTAFQLLHKLVTNIQKHYKHWYLALVLYDWVVFIHIWANAIRIKFPIKIHKHGVSSHLIFTVQKRKSTGGKRAEKRATTTMMMLMTTTTTKTSKVKRESMTNIIVSLQSAP